MGSCCLKSGKGEGGWKGQEKKKVLLQRLSLGHTHIHTYTHTAVDSYWWYPSHVQVEGMIYQRLLFGVTYCIIVSFTNSGVGQVLAMYDKITDGYWVHPKTRWKLKYQAPNWEGTKDMARNRAESSESEELLSLGPVLIYVPLEYGWVSTKYRGAVSTVRKVSQHITMTMTMAMI